MTTKVREFQVTTEKVQTFREGWGVAISPIHAGEDADYPDAVVDIDVSVVRITEGDVAMIGNVPCVASQDLGYWCPVENFRELADLTEGDTHDLRERWFATREEAEDHARYTKERFDNPSPWESFVRFN